MGFGRVQSGSSELWFGFFVILSRCIGFLRGFSELSSGLNDCTCWFDCIGF